MKGIMIVGTHQHCGKTAVIAGLAAAMNDAGFRVQAFKPLEFTQDAVSPPGQDQAYLNKITQQFMTVDTLSLPTSHTMTTPLWNKMLEQCKTLAYPCLLEAPRHVATPWMMSERRLLDAIDVAAQLDLPVLLIAQGGMSFMEQTRAALAFLKARPVEVLGFIQNQTQPLASPDEETLAAADALMLSQTTNTPFLGTLPYSPSIQVAGLQQGNLIRLTQDHIDLLPLQMGIGLTL